MRRIEDLGVDKQLLGDGAAYRVGNSGTGVSEGAGEIVGEGGERG